ncbi:MAG: tRNA pseudouridine(38-40) synthase TruA [Candidatus Omnitrophica bacterium]|nr:tRNA pseudouridine(38-40) synthase TruA [Candidatus Omnitrophota bacterium]MBU4590129.1 tRNA pseudouridine(38-40) synthase TruA [Candidatus Omnitrophota bacterium]
MTRNIRLTIEYDGSRFCGWQTQRRTRRKTVQEEVEKAGRKLFGKKINLIGAGRTDSGVHAEAQVANFRVDSRLPLRNIKKGLNSHLPKDIAILSAEDVKSDFHARFDAREKLYKYTIINRKVRSPLLKRHAAFISYDLDIGAMKKAARHFVGKKDFRSFQASDKKERHSVRTVTKCDVISRHPIVDIYIQADGFLYNMVRNIVGTLIDVGRGRTKPEQVKKILFKRHRSAAGQTAPAKGLCLVKVLYQPLI